MKCPRCDYIVDIPQNFCPLCGGIFESTSQKHKSSESAVISWENSSAKDYPLSAFLETIQDSFFKTECFFSKVKNSDAILPAWLYGIICGSIGMIAGFLWSVFLPGTLTINMSTGSESAYNLILSPALISFQIFFTTAYIQFLLFLFRSKRAPFSATFKVSCYALGPMILNTIPVAGPLLAVIMWFYQIVSGIHQVHQISKWKALAILIFPVFFLIFIIILFAMAIGIGGIAASGLFS